jgi:hypothetical protein
MPRGWINKAAAALAAPLLLTGARAFGQAQTAHAQHQEPTMLATPPSIAAEHHELHETLARASNEAGELGLAARELERALAPHFKREEEIATPPLSLLPALAKGEATPEMRSVLPMTQALERELPQMLREHEAIREALGKFRSAAERAGKQDYVRFAEALAAHTREEEEILYPAAVLVGRYVARAAPD